MTTNMIYTRNLNYLRIALMLHVFLFHYNMHIERISIPVFDSFICSGFIAMSGFFLLSGFVLCYKYLEFPFKEGNNLLNYYKKRFHSIFPTFLTCILLNYVLNIKSFGFKEVGNLLIGSTGIHTFFDPDFFHEPFGGAWFISCLLFCYIFSPIIFIYLYEKNEHMLGGGALGITILYFLILVLTLFPCFFGEYSHHEYANPFYRAIEFGIGICVCIIVKKHKMQGIKNYMYLMGFFCAGAILICGVNKLYGMTGNSYTSICFFTIPCYAAIIICLTKCSIKWLNRIAESKICNYFAGLCFEVYLTQFLVFGSFCFLRKNVFVYFSVNIVLALCLRGIVRIEKQVLLFLISFLEHQRLP